MERHETDDYDRVKCRCWPRNWPYAWRRDGGLREAIAVDCGNHTKTKGPRFGKVLGAH